MVKNNEAGNSLNAVEREPVPMRVLNPKASGAWGQSLRWGVQGDEAARKKKKKHLWFFEEKKFGPKFKKKCNFQIYMEDSESAE